MATFEVQYIGGYEPLTQFGTSKVDGDGVEMTSDWLTIFVGSGLDRMQVFAVPAQSVARLTRHDYPAEATQSFRVAYNYRSILQVDDVLGHFVEASADWVSIQATSGPNPYAVVFAVPAKSVRSVIRIDYSNEFEVFGSTPGSAV